MSLPDNGDDLHDEMVERIDVGVECPHCHGGPRGITAGQDVTGRTLFVRGCAAQWTSYTSVIRPRRSA